MGEIRVETMDSLQQGLLERVGWQTVAVPVSRSQQRISERTGGQVADVLVQARRRSMER